MWDAGFKRNPDKCQLKPPHLGLEHPTFTSDSHAIKTGSDQMDHSHRESSSSQDEGFHGAARQSEFRS